MKKSDLLKIAHRHPHTRSDIVPRLRSVQAKYSDRFDNLISEFSSDLLWKGSFNDLENSLDDLEAELDSVQSNLRQVEKDLKDGARFKYIDGDLTLIDKDGSPIYDSPIYQPTPDKQFEEDVEDYYEEAKAEFRSIGSRRNQNKKTFSKIQQTWDKYDGWVDDTLNPISNRYAQLSKKYNSMKKMISRVYSSKHMAK